MHCCTPPELEATARKKQSGARGKKTTKRKGKKKKKAAKKKLKVTRDAKGRRKKGARKTKAQKAAGKRSAAAMKKKVQTPVFKVGETSFENGGPLLSGDGVVIQNLVLRNLLVTDY